LPLTLLASAGMGVALWFGAAALAPFFENGLLVSIAALFALIAGGVLVYFLLCEVTGASRLRDLRSAFTRR
ncbi:MAG TPA: lipid II flippase MurJ, partial [Rhodobiaceae bacterium]|nr:lipid II flippase MurJ [Rhodobiaceae bacterium]